MTRCLGLQVQARQAATSCVTWTSLAHGSPSETVHAGGFTKQLDVFMEERLARSLHATMPVGLIKSPCCKFLEDGTIFWRNIHMAFPVLLLCPRHPLLATTRKRYRLSGPLV